MVLTVTLNPALDKMVRVGTLSVGKETRVQSVSVYAGGKGVNVARALIRLGVKATASGVAGGANGFTLCEKLAEEKIPYAILAVPGETRVNVTMVDARENFSRVIEPGAEISSLHLAEYRDFFKKEMKKALKVVISGSLPPGGQPNFYASLIELAKSAGKEVALDASREAFLEGLKACPDIIKPNCEEAEAACGFPLNSLKAIRQALQYFSDQGIKKTLISLGGEGLAAADGKDFFMARGPKLKGHAVGSGDAVLAGFIAAQMRGAEFEESVKFATACGTANVLNEMPPGNIDHKAVKKFFTEVVVTRLRK
ncbi:MAG: 1-phosphofructokinase family hexose kinase [Candidatus Omnitrophica bacterium]|nr:1-phosphofructokinase family hexose kinase [Candidatus Omnitrophota bacterium]